MVGGGETLRADIGHRGDALADSGAVADQQEMDFAAGAAAVEPSPQRHLLAGMGGELIDIDAVHATI